MSSRPPRRQRDDIPEGPFTALAISPGGDVLVEHGRQDAAVLHVGRDGSATLEEHPCHEESSYWRVPDPSERREVIEMIRSFLEQADRREEK
jgi:hypothetical protein